MEQFLVILKNPSDKILYLLAHLVFRKVCIDSLLKLQQKEGKTLTIRLGKQKFKLVTISLEDHKNMKIRQIFKFHGLRDYGFTSLLINDNIVESNEKLNNIPLALGETEAIPLLPYQMFYNQMSHIFNKLSLRENLEELIDSVAKKNPSLKKYLDGRYTGLRSSQIDRGTQLSIIYLTSSYFKPSFQKSFFQKYMKSQTENEDYERKTDLVCMMASSISGLSNNGDAQLIYFIERTKIPQNFKIGEIRRLQCIVPAFTDPSLASKEKRKANNPQQQVYVFQIEHLTAKCVGMYNGQVDGYNYIVMPFTEYYTQSFRTVNEVTHIRLVEIPIPRELYSNLVIWIDDKMMEGRSFQNKHLKAQDTGIEILYFKNNKRYQFWLKHYFSLTLNRQVRVITNMSRKQSPRAGLESIRLTKKYLSVTELMLYVRDTEACANILAESNEPDMESPLISSNPNILEDFIKSISPYNNTATENQCEVSKCAIF